MGRLSCPKESDTRTLINSRTYQKTYLSPERRQFAWRPGAEFRSTSTGSAVQRNMVSMLRSGSQSGQYLSSSSHRLARKTHRNTRQLTDNLTECQAARDIAGCREFWTRGVRRRRPACYPKCARRLRTRHPSRPSRSLTTGWVPGSFCLRQRGRGEAAVAVAPDSSTSADENERRQFQVWEFVESPPDRAAKRSAADRAQQCIRTFLH